MLFRSEYFWDVSFALDQEFLVNIEFGLGLVRSLIGVEFVTHLHRVELLVSWLEVIRVKEGLRVSHVLISLHGVVIEQIL